MRPNMEAFYCMRNNKLRKLYQEVAKKTPNLLSNLGTLIKNTKPLMRSIYRMNSSRLNERHNTEKVVRHLMATNEGIVQLLMDFKCFLIQYNEVRKKNQDTPSTSKYCLRNASIFSVTKNQGVFSHS